jgi:hypothetical protein
VQHDPSSNVVRLRPRSASQADLGALAREQLRHARLSRGLSEAELAELLTPLVGWEVSATVVQSWERTAIPPGDVLVAAGLLESPTGTNADTAVADADVLSRAITQRFLDLAEIYLTRADFAAALPPRDLFDGATQIKMVGLSLNLLCQQYGDRAITQLLRDGTTMRLLFLDPASEYTSQREEEEGDFAGHLATLTELNIQVLTARVRQALATHEAERLQVATYSAPVRFNITLIDDSVCVGSAISARPSRRGLPYIRHPQKGRSRGTIRYL